jgi:hypothetical protein
VRIWGQINYKRETGLDEYAASIHSDICFPVERVQREPIDAEIDSAANTARDYLHNILDEWLDQQVSHPESTIKPEFISTDSRDWRKLHENGFYLMLVPDHGD